MEDLWTTQQFKLENYTKELKIWKKSVVKQLEEQRAKNFDHMVALKKSAAEETAK